MILHNLLNSKSILYITVELSYLSKSQKPLVAEYEAG